MVLLPVWLESIFIEIRALIAINRETNGKNNSFTEVRDEGSVIEFGASCWSTQFNYAAYESYEISFNVEMLLLVLIVKSKTFLISGFKSHRHNNTFPTVNMYSETLRLGRTNPLGISTLFVVIYETYCT